MVEPVHLSGTTLEGGGQLLRIAIGVSALTRLPIHITDIRGNRSGGGGLKLQHLTAIKWLANASSATSTGAVVKSRTLDFRPSLEHDCSKSLSSDIDVGSPGSVGLVLQAILPFVLFSGCQQGSIHITIKGGTNVSMSPSIDYIQQVLLPTLSRIGLPPITAALNHRGWSTGRTEMGSVTFTITPLGNGARLPGFNLSSRGSIKHIQATVLAPRSCEKQARDLLAAALGQQFPHLDVDITFEDSKHSKRLYLLLVATSGNGYKLARDWLYSGKSTSPNDAVPRLISQVVSELAAEIEHGGCVDEYMRDQLVVFQALAQGKSVVDGGRADGKSVEPSLHAKTAQWVVDMLLGVEFDGSGWCKGIGLSAGEDYAKRKDGDESVTRLIDTLHV
ncbi:hypothetical protein LTS18_005858 [Coniosporium uncinatum]|uniref:Uncharacterized protein n=1 Tax=Coniosporium uncinatum TaxID=93489 RepID=A0ACC3D4J3_9PEZI|nr:hypothetical protein LTS18_005858 [Coniosporium uncinatum]